MRNLLKLRFLCTFLTLFLVLSLIVEGCGKKEEKEEAKSATKRKVAQKASEEKVIKIGAILPLTGKLAWLGEEEKDIIEFAMNRMKQKYALTLEVKFEDAKSFPKEAASAANKLLASGYKIILVSTTPLASAIIPINENGGALTVVHSMTNKLVQQGELVIRIYPSINDEIIAIGPWLNKFFKIAFIKFKSEWADLWVSNFLDTFPNHEILEEDYDLQNLNIKNILIKIKSWQPDIIFLLGYGSEYPIILKQIREIGIDSKLAGNISFLYSGFMKKIQKIGLPVEYFNKVVFPGPSINLESSTFKKLADQFKREYKKSILTEPTALYFYDTIEILCIAIKNVGEKPTKIKDYVTTVKKFNTLTGEIIFKDNGDVAIPLKLFTYQNGRLIPYVENGK